MSSNSISGKNFSFDGSTVDFFGAKAMRSGDFCAINIGVGEEVMIQVDPSNHYIRGCILDCIKDDTKAGKRDKIAYVIVGRRGAAELYIDNTITVEHLRNAREGSDYVDIPGITFDDLPVTVRVDPNQGGIFCATANKDCAIII